MADEQTNNIAPVLIQYAAPKGPPRTWLPCIVGLFVWGILAWMLIPLIIIVLYCSAAPWEDFIFILMVAAIILLPIGLPPIILARRLMRGNVKGVVIARVVIGMLSVFAIPFSIIGLFMILTIIHASWFTLLGIIPAAFSGSGLWLAAKLFALDAFPQDPSETTDFHQQSEEIHGEQ